MPPSSQHRNANRNYRPTPDEYDGPGRVAIEAAGYPMGTAVRAFLRWLNDDPERLAQLAPYLAAVKEETRYGRPWPSTTPQD
jgi:hypothetical protein